MSIISELRLWNEVKREVNPTMYWLGDVVNPPAWEEAPFLAVDLDPPWYHCKPCIDGGVSRFDARLSIGDKFCSNCGGQLDWPS